VTKTYRFFLLFVAAASFVGGMQMDDWHANPDNETSIGEVICLPEVPPIINAKEIDYADQHTALPERSESVLPAELNIEGDSGSAIEAQLAYLNMQASVNNYDRWVESHAAKAAQFIVADAMQKNFNEEDVEPDWSYREELNVTDMFYESDELEGLALLEVECRKTQCRVTVAANNIAQANEIVARVSNGFASENDYRQLVAAPSHEKRATTLYISRDSDGFKFDE